ncbi:MAG: response regulator [Syntrophomonas sp.]
MVGGAIRVLLVEDDEVSRIVTERFLKSKGYQVHTAINGQEAIDLLARETYDIVLMDIILPQVGGFHLARQMRKHPNTQNIPIIAMSAFLNDDDLENKNVREMNAFLSKPFKPDELQETILRLTSLEQQELDWPGLLARTGGDTTFIQEVAEIFCGSSRGLIAEIEDSTDFDDISELAHRLKGSAAMAGALLIIEVAARIQEASNKRDEKAIKAECKFFESNLQNYVKCLADKGYKLKTLI